MYYVCLFIGAISKTSFYSESVLPHTLFNMSCSGDESTLFDCRYSTDVPDGSNCYSNEDAAVICQGWNLHEYVYSTCIVDSIDINVTPSNCTDYDVRLVDGDTTNEGKVLMCINGVWGTLCHSSLNTIDAAVICATAGYPKG